MLLGLQHKGDFFFFFFFFFEEGSGGSRAIWRIVRTFGKILATPQVRDQEFSSSKQVLEGKAKQLRLAGQGKRPNKARQVSDEAGIAENSEVKNPESLIQTMWLLLIQHFGLLERQEHRGMRLEGQNHERWRRPRICWVCRRAYENKTWRFERKVKAVSAQNVSDRGREVPSCLISSVH